MNIKIFGIGCSPRSVISLFILRCRTGFDQGPGLLMSAAWYQTRCTGITDGHEFYQFYVCVFLWFQSGDRFGMTWTALTVSRTIAHGVHDSVIASNGLESNCKEAVVASLWHCYAILLKGMRQITTYLIQTVFGQNSNRVPSEEKWEATCLVSVCGKAGYHCTELGRCKARCTFIYIYFYAVRKREIPLKTSSFIPFLLQCVQPFVRFFFMLYKLLDVLCSSLGGNIDYLD